MTRFLREGVSAKDRTLELRFITRNFSGPHETAKQGIYFLGKSTLFSYAGATMMNLKRGLWWECQFIP